MYCPEGTRHGGGSAENASVIAFVAMGSNLGPRREIFDRAIELMQKDLRVRVVKRSAWYETNPSGQAQPRYLNGAIKLETELLPEVLLAWLHVVERACGRVRSGGRWGPRLLDLDLISYSSMEVFRPGIRLPHPGWRRSFVRIPLADIGGVPAGIS